MTEVFKAKPAIVGKFELRVKTSDGWKTIYEGINQVVKTGCTLLAKAICGDSGGFITKLWLSDSTESSTSIEHTFNTLFADTDITASLALVVDPTYSSTTGYSGNQAKLVFSGEVADTITIRWVALTNDANIMYNESKLAPAQEVTAGNTLMAVWTLEFTTALE